MDRSRRQGGWGERGEKDATPPAASRLTIKPRRNRRRPSSLWTRVPKPRIVVDACGRALRRSLPALVGAGVLAAVGGTAWAGYRWVTHSPRFAITQITVRGNQRLTDEQLRQTLPVRVGDNVFAADLGAALHALEAEPWVAEAAIHRVLPHTLAIDVREHVAAAVVELGGTYLVDGDGHAFKRAIDGAGDGAGLPLVTGLERTGYLADPEAAAAQIRSALAALASWRETPTRPAIAEIRVGDHGELALRTAEHATEIQLGAVDGDLPARLATFDLAWAALDDTERDAALAIHLDPRSDHVTVSFAKDQ